MTEKHEPEKYNATPPTPLLLPYEYGLTPRQSESWCPLIFTAIAVFLIMSFLLRVVFWVRTCPFSSVFYSSTLWQVLQGKLGTHMPWSSLYGELPPDSRRRKMNGSMELHFLIQGNRLIEHVDCYKIKYKAHETNSTRGKTRNQEEDSTENR